MNNVRKAVAIQRSVIHFLYKELLKEGLPYNEFSKKKAGIVFRHSLKWYTLCRCRLFENVWFEHVLLYMYKYVQTWLENNFFPQFFFFFGSYHILQFITVTVCIIV